MIRKWVVVLCLILLPAVVAPAQETETEVEDQAAADQGAAEQTAEEQTDAKELSGMSIVGNDEAPKSLYIVPWKSSEIGVETSLNRMLDEGDVPVDREVFQRQLEFYQVRTAE